MKGRVLVVDDNPINLELIGFVLDSGGFEVTTAATAEEALQVAPVLKPDILIADIQLPGMSGLDLMRQFRGRPEHARVCIIAVTSYAMESDRETAYEAGCDGYLTKPVDTRTLAEKVHECWLQRQQRS